jgi:dTDP-4-amino-4,6-dideoxy-D-glucose acyltransferase
MIAQPATYTPEELTARGVRFGENVSVHRTVEFFGGNFVFGSHIRIDCHCVLTSKEPVVLGNNVHLGVGVQIFGSAGFIMEDFSGIAPRCSIFTTSDDYSHGYLTNPTVPDEFKKTLNAPVKLEAHVIIGCGSIIMPGVIIRRGASVGALSYVTRSIPEFVVVSGRPLRRIGVRDKTKLEELRAQYEAEKMRIQ